ncbi:MAG: DNA mismatch repair protein MutL, partial [Alphaproteobacteria bacterium]|nr:DNA mismatch repair protein MutL [Alphaproteobacteria bacterium]
KDTAAIRGLLVGSIRRALTENSARTSTTIGDITLHKSIPSILPKRQHSTEPSYIFQQSAQMTQPIMAMEVYSVKKDTPTMEHTETAVQPISQTVAEERPAMQSMETAIIQQKTGTAFPPLGFAKAQLHETYIVSQTLDSIVITDQHAAHERLTYEKIMADIGTNPKTQLLLIPEIIDLNQNEVDTLIGWKNELAKMGLVLDAFGYDSIAVREIPTILDKTDIKNLIQDLVDTLKEFGDTVVLQDKIKDICAKMACHGSIRSGRKLTIEEMNALLRQMEQCGTSGQCIHGRPTYIELKLNDIERLFGRK